MAAKTPKPKKSNGIAIGEVMAEAAAVGLGKFTIKANIDGVFTDAARPNEAAVAHRLVHDSLLAGVEMTGVFLQAVLACLVTGDSQGINKLAAQFDKVRKILRESQVQVIRRVAEGKHAFPEVEQAVTKAPPGLKILRP